MLLPVMKLLILESEIIEKTIQIIKPNQTVTFRNFSKNQLKFSLLNVCLAFTELCRALMRKGQNMFYVIRDKALLLGRALYNEFEWKLKTKKKFRNVSRNSSNEF